MLRGRLGLETARIPHADRHGLLWLSRDALTVRDGTLRFERESPADSKSPLESGSYGIPFQTLSMILLGPGSTVSHDALRLMARHGTALVAVGEDGVRCAPGGTRAAAASRSLAGCTRRVSAKSFRTRTSMSCGGWRGRA